jgi:1-aminocyclopropane-1-carboxylate deaminase/D-cysteine desulfhydrase-like pyridoxal-dependent ACC family enzyme
MPEILPEGPIGSQGTAGVVATATTIYSISKDGTTAGTMVFAVGATSTFTMMATTYVAGDILTVVAGVRRDIG